MKNTMLIVIQKNKQHVRFYVNKEELTLARICALCKEKHVSLCHVQTFEAERKLVDCYIPFRDDEAFRIRLIKAAKAKA